MIPGQSTGWIQSMVLIQCMRPAQPGPYTDAWEWPTWGLIPPHGVGLSRAWSIHMEMAQLVSSPSALKQAGQGPISLCRAWKSGIREPVVVLILIPSCWILIPSCQIYGPLGSYANQMAWFFRPDLAYGLGL